MTGSTFKTICLMILTVGTLLLSCGGDEPAEETRLRPVRYQQVYATGGSRVRTFSGVARAGSESRLSFKIPGTVQDLLVKVGDRVKSGQVIARLDPQDYTLQVQGAEATLEQAKAQSRNASAAYDRVRSLYENRNASQNDLDGARAAHESAEAAVQAAGKQLERARLQLEYTELKVQTDGAIASVYVEVNENTGAGGPVAMMTSGSQMEVDVSIPEILIARVREGQKVEVSFDAVTGRTFEAVVTEVGVASTGLVTTFPVSVVLKKASSEIRPGMAAQVSFKFESSLQTECFLVPPVAVGEDTHGRYVFVVTSQGPETGIVSRRAVTVGDLTNDGLEVLEGLTDGDLVITAGISKLIDNMQVKLPRTAEDES